MAKQRKQSPAQKLAFQRNGFLGQLHMARTTMNNICKASLVSVEDAKELRFMISRLDVIIGRWYKHYVKKNIKTLTKVKS